MKKRFRKLKEIFTHKQGTTIVEFIVCFLLISLMLAGISQMVIVSMEVYQKIRDMNQACQVSDTLLDKICGEIEGAQTGVAFQTGEEADGREENATLIIEDSNKKIDLYDRTGSHIYITVSGKKLKIHYYEVISVSEDSGNRTTCYEAVDWKFDDKAYMGFEIEDLRFLRSEENLPNVITVQLTIGKDGKKFVSRTRYVKCYNFQDELDFEKIKEKTQAVQ
ncbi:MAG: hypothetical protein PUH29_04170 [Lachnospiraceae bacterium]|nr:hypothetical protein [Lachnospiraceae bacterium]MDY5496704.1 hypothetical protein [Anaerobutyricum sp.]